MLDMKSSLVMNSVLVSGIVCVCLLAQLAGAAPRKVRAHGRVGDDCRLKRFSECRCDQFAVFMRENERDAYEDAVTVHERLNVAPNSKNRFYYCAECTRCGDGMRVENQCTPRSDTECSTDKCEDETWEFNFFLKACLPPPTQPTSTPSSTVKSEGVGEGTITKATELAKGLKVEEDEGNTGSSAWFQKNSHVIIIGLMGGVIVLLAVIVIMAVSVSRMRQRVESLLASPMSSHHSSRVSVAPPTNV